jgi:outer membrane immunogenic protein
MKRLSVVLVATVAAFNFTHAAFAADMPTKAPAAPLPPAYNWTGFYIGGYYGTAVGSQTGSTPTDVLGSRTGQTNVNKWGAVGGLTAGYNWQFAPHWLVGLEGEFGYLGISRSNIEFNDDTTVGLKTDWYGTARARIGYVTGPSLIYATGGAAFVHSRDEFGGDAPNNTVPSTLSSKTTASWTAGYGVETKLSRAWSAKTEYLFIDGGGNNNFIANPRGNPGVPSTFDHGYHLVKSGLNYKLGESESFFAFMNAPMMPSDHDWRGLYVGVNVGGGQSLVHTTQTSPNFPFGVTDVNGTGFAGGGQIGYNFTGVLMPKFFAGVEGDIGALRVHAQMNDWFDAQAKFTANTDWYATLRGRFGINTGPALLYFTAGGAWVHLTDGFPPAFFAGGDVTSKAAGGWTIGGGTEVALDAHWSARVESLYMDVGHQTHFINPPPSTFGAEFKNRFQVVRAGLNYKIW